MSSNEVERDVDHYLAHRVQIQPRLAGPRRVAYRLDSGLRAAPQRPGKSLRTFVCERLEADSDLRVLRLKAVAGGVAVGSELGAEVDRLVPSGRES